MQGDPRREPEGWRMLLAVGLTVAITGKSLDLIAAHRVASSSTVVVSQGKIVFTGAFGMSDLQGHVSALPETLYHIGPLTELLTAVAVMQLVEQHKLSLDDTLAKYVPGIPNSREITIADLLTHRSGIREYANDALVSGRVRFPTTPAAIVNAIANFPPTAPPGTAFGYSKSNYVLLGLIVEQVSGESLHAYYRKHIFEPAGMTHTYAGVAPATESVAVGYELLTQSTPQLQADPSWYFGCADVLSTATDLARFDIAWMNGDLLQPATRDLMYLQAVPISDGPSASGIGFGMMRQTFGTQMMVGRRGGMPGFEADDEMILNDRFAVVTLGNDGLYPTGAAAGAAVQTMYPSDYAAAMAAAANNAPPEGEREALTQRFTAVFAGLIQGNVQPDEFTPAMNNKLTPAAVQFYWVKPFAKFGRFEKLEFVTAERVGAFLSYHYVAVFENKRQPLTFILNADQKLDGLLSM